VELDFYDDLAAKKAVAASGASSSSAGTSTTASYAGPSGTNMDTDFWESIIRESDKQSGDDGF
jgi:hypothetical protein